ncbi:MAG: cytochrome P450 [Candidatus Promineifilaceae bacterium]
MHTIINPDTYINGVPHDEFKHLRENDAVFWTEEPDGAGFWSLTRYDDVIEASRNTKLFSSAKGIRLEDMAEDELLARTTMMELDPPEHTTYRRMVSQPFHRREVLGYDATMRELAREVIDAVKDRTELDFVTELARQLPMRMLGKMLGVADADGPWMVAAGDALIGNSDPEFTEFVVDQVDTEAFRLLPFRSPVSLKLFELAGRMADEKRRCPAHDVTTNLLAPKRDGGTLSDLEFKNFFTLLVAAGNDTTRYTMAAGMHALLENPDQLALLKAQPDLMDSAVEEMLRWGSVTMHFRRTAMADVEMGGKLIKKGDKVCLWYISADFDPDQFPDPYTFDITRTHNPHMAFGLKSPHKCLGEHLARLEIKVLFEELLPQITDIQLNGEIERLRSNFISGIKHLPVRITWA